MTKVTDNLNEVVANSYSLYLKTQNYHWNVTGPSFKTFHELFELQYNELAPAIDDLAERIRALGEKVDGTYESFNKLTKFKEANKNLSSQEMIEDLVKSHETVISILNDGIATAEDSKDHGTADMLTARVEQHQKHVWMLSSSIG